MLFPDVASKKLTGDIIQSKRRAKSFKKQNRQDKEVPFGGRWKTRSSISHVHASPPLKTLLQMGKLCVTKPGFVSIQDKGIVKVKHTLEDMVGKHKFELKEWDGW